jgi:hypothetical protein
MDNFSAFAMGQANRGKESMVFDWIKAATIIKKRKPKNASAGLSGDWEWTGGEIFKNGKPVPQEDTDTFLSSTWATPELEIDGEIIECYKMQNEVPDWDSGTYWPEKALKILNQR